MLKKITWVLAIFSLFFLTRVQPAFAAVAPDFPSCPNPGGQQIVSYPDGIHGIPGDQSTHTGSDSVYSTGENQLVQCFCADGGVSGIQTNWWKVGSLDQEQIDTLKNQGWIYVPDGSVWGLEDTAYFAQNVANSCGSSNGGGGGGGSVSTPTCNDSKPGTPTLLTVDRNGATAKLTWTAASNATDYTIAYGYTPGNYIFGVSSTGNVTSFTVGSLDPNATYYFAVRAVNHCMPGDLSGQPTGQIGGEVLGLAFTGGIDQLLIASGAGIGLLALALILRKKQATS